MERRRQTLEPDQAQWRSIPSILAGLAYVAGYSLLFFAVTVASALALHRLAPGAPKWLFPVSHGVLWIAGVVLATWLVRVKLNRAPWAGMALPTPQIGSLVLGFAAGAALLLLVFAVQHQLGWLNVTGVAPISTAAPKLALALLPSLGVGVAEELAFRGYVFQTLGERMPIWAAAGLSALIFAMYHFSLGGFGPGFAIVVMCFALTYTVVRLATGSLWFPIGFHAAWDWVQVYLIGVANVGQPGHDPALVRVSQSGPGLWVGTAPAIEGGLIYSLAILSTLAAAVAYAAARGRLPHWTRRLDADGRALGA
jgi:membrane protease YdiL (CAAX protease family)